MSEEISTEWKDLGRHLGLKDAKLDHIQANNLLNQQEQVYKILLTWMQANTKDATTYSILFEALKKVGRGALIDKIKDVRGKVSLNFDTNEF